MTRWGKRFLISVLTSFVVATVGFAVAPSTTFGATLQELRKKREQLARDAEQNRKKAQEQKKKAEEFKKQIGKLDGDIAATESKIASTEGQIKDAVATIDVLNQKIAQKQLELNDAQDKQREALVEIYTAPSYSLPLLAASSETITEESDRVAYLSALEDTIDKTIQEITGLKTQLQNQKKEQQDREESLRLLKTNLEQYHKGLDSQKDKKSKLLANATSAAEEFQKKFEEAKKLSAQVESELNALAKASAKGGAIKSKDKGTSAVGFIWPMDFDTTTTEFGNTDGSYPFYPAILFHAGLDVVNKACGTPVMAAADGIANIRGTGNQGYGNYIVVGHNERFSTLYGHLQSFVVSDGEEVKQGDIIGYEGTTGWSTGCHLHFEVWDNGERKNPRNYLN